MKNERAKIHKMNNLRISKIVQKLKANFTFLR